MFDELKSIIKQRTLEQVERHQRVNPNATLEQIVDIQLAQEREKLLKMAEEFEDQEQELTAEACRKLANDWLPSLRAELVRL